MLSWIDALMKQEQYNDLRARQKKERSSAVKARHLPVKLYVIFGKKSVRSALEAG